METEDRLLNRDAGSWSGFQAGARDGDLYRLWIIGSGSNAYERDPYARELAGTSGFPNCFCVLRATHAYPWHDSNFRMPDFSDMVIYQAHIGTYAIPKSGDRLEFSRCSRQGALPCRFRHKCVPRCDSFQMSVETSHGIILSNSHSTPLRRGTTGISIGFYGFEALWDYRGQSDLTSSAAL